MRQSDPALQDRDRVPLQWQWNGLSRSPLGARRILIQMIVPIKYQKVVIVGILSLFISCTKNPASPTTPSEDRPIIDEKNNKNILLNLIDYDVVHILHQSGLDLRSSKIIRTIIGSKSMSGFRQLYSSTSTYDQEAKSYILHFDFSVKMDSSQINAPLTIRYYSFDSSYIDVDTTVALFKYPYNSTEIIADSTILPDGEPFQDISRIGSKLYYHPLGPWGLFEFDLISKSKQLLTNYPGGDHLAADSNFVFCDIGHNSVYRYNTLTKTIDFVFPLPTSIDLDGMAIFNNALYIYMSEQGISSLKKLTYDGKLLDSIAYPRYVYYLAIYDSIVYSAEYFNNSATQISRFDLRNKTYLSNVISPAYWIDGIKVYGDRLYFCDDFKKCVSSVPFAKLIEVDTTHKNTKSSRRAPNQALKLTVAS
ncbi:MAG: hypothetical protein NTX44_00060 [Ignavibacteriales bacterium]|nr:hypothetical protein [Ignavibacteriales bacterium]